MSSVLWVVQDGILSGPGASQTVPYLCGLSAEGIAMSLLSFEKEGLLGDRERVRGVREELRHADVEWTALPYGRGHPAGRTLAQIGRAVATGRGIVSRRRVDLVHARSYVPALMALGMGRPFLFDMRGHWPQERVDGGIWTDGGRQHRLWTRLERVFLDRAAGVVVLAEGAREHLPAIDKPFRVIPTAVDLDRFRPGLPLPKDAGPLAGKNVFIISGALGTWYLLDEMLDLAALALERDSRGHLLILTEEDASAAVRGLAARGVAANRVTVRGVPHREVPNWFSLGHVGIFLIESAPSKRASAPTKLGEFLACGVPVILTPAIGDSDRLVEDTRTGVVVGERSRAAYARALDELGRLREEGAGLVDRCRNTARERLSLSAAVQSYAELYRLLGLRVRGNSCV